MALEERRAGELNRVVKLASALDRGSRDGKGFTWVP